MGAFVGCGGFKWASLGVRGGVKGQGIGGYSLSGPFVVA